MYSTDSVVIQCSTIFTYIIHFYSHLKSNSDLSLIFIQFLIDNKLVFKFRQKLYSKSKFLYNKRIEMSDI